MQLDPSVFNYILASPTICCSLFQRQPPKETECNREFYHWPHLCLPYKASSPPGSWRDLQRDIHSCIQPFDRKQSCCMWSKKWREKNKLQDWCSQFPKDLHLHKIKVSDTLHSCSCTQGSSLEGLALHQDAQNQQQITATPNGVTLIWTAMVRTFCWKLIDLALGHSC